MASVVSLVDSSSSDVEITDPAARFTTNPSITTMQPVDWEYVPEVENGMELPQNVLTPGGLLVALWSTGSSYPAMPGLQSMDLRPCSMSTLTCRPRPPANYPPRPTGTTSFIHIPYCKLDVRIAPSFPSASANGSSAPIHMERVGLPRTLVQEFRARINLPVSPADGTPLRSDTNPHFDDDDEWVYSRCILTDFTGVTQNEAASLSSQGRLCCWASVILEQRHDDSSNQVTSWDLGFIVHRVGVCAGDPSSKTGGCRWVHG